jgi:Ran GTPase-activating protein (RanGAP) involved in mRNA processing and transport
LYSNNRILDLRKFTSKYIEPLTDKDLLPLFHALAYNHYFTKVILKHFKFSEKSWQGVIEMMAVNDTIQSLVLQDITFTGGADKCWFALFEAIAKNTKSPLHSLSLADSPIEDKAMQPLGEWLRKLTRGVIKLNFNNTCGEKAGKSTGMLVRHSTCEI